MNKNFGAKIVIVIQNIKYKIQNDNACKLNIQILSHNLN